MKNYKFGIILILIFISLESKSQENLSDHTFASFTSINGGTFNSGMLNFTMTNSGVFEQDAIGTYTSSYTLPSGFVANSLPNPREIEKLKETSNTFNSKNITFDSDLFASSYIFLEDVDVNEELRITFKDANGIVINPSLASNIMTHSSFSSGAPMVNTTNTVINLTGRGSGTNNRVVILEVVTNQVKTIQVEIRGMANGQMGLYMAVPSSPLPVELINFNANVESINVVRLNWQTLSELSNDYFTLERSQNIVDWDVIGHVDGAGNSSQLVEYSFADESSPLGIAYYRLKQIDFNGEFTYSSIISVVIEEYRASAVKVYPNPSANLITINSSNLLAQEGIRIFDGMGKEFTGAVSLSVKNNTLIEMDISNLAAGLYFVQTSSATNKFYKR